MKPSIILACSLALFSISCKQVCAEMKTIKGNNTSLFSEPSEKSTVKWEYGNGYPVKVLSTKGEWVKIQDFENDSGWIKNNFLTTKPSAIVKVNKGKNKKINIRSGPGENYNTVGQAYYGVVFEKLKKEKGWVKIKHESGLEGWIQETLLWGY